MTFTKKFKTLIKKSNDNIIKFNLDSGVNLEEYRPSGELLYSKKLAKGNFTFVDLYFDISTSDYVYGLINDKKGSLIYIFLDENIITKTTFLNYDSKSSELKFIYIKKLNSTNHIIFYLIDRNKNICELIHHYKKKNKWLRTEVDKFSFGILSNFVVNISENFLRVFYFKIVDSFEEIFLSNFDLQKESWLPPIQITNSHKSKVYLSVVNSSPKNYHIVFSENNRNHYFCRNITLSVENNFCTIKDYISISETIACMFPHLILYKDKLYAQWIEYNDLNTSISSDLGKTWTNPKKNDLPFFPFSRYDYKSNSSKDDDYILSTVYCEDSSSTFLGLPKED